MTHPSEPSPFLIIPIILGFAVVFPLMWMGVIGLISLIGGWSRLATRFRCEAAPPGKRRHGVGGRLGVANYSGTLNVIVAEEGLYLELHPLFRAFHPPLLIPWEEVRDLQPRTSLWGMFGFKSSFRLGSTRMLLTLPVEELQPPARA